MSKSDLSSSLSSCRSMFLLDVLFEAACPSEGPLAVWVCMVLLPLVHCTDVVSEAACPTVNVPCKEVPCKEVTLPSGPSAKGPDPAFAAPV